MLGGYTDREAGTPTLSELNDAPDDVRRGQGDAVDSAGWWAGAALRRADAGTLLGASELLVRVTDGHSRVRRAEPGVAEALRLPAQALSVAGRMGAAELAGPPSHVRAAVAPATQRVPRR